MVYDIFSFFYELDLLEIRLNILNDYVDKFVIVEANESFMGEKKPLYFKENIGRFEKWKHKIIHYVVDDFPDDLDLYNMAKNSPNVGRGEHWWVREFYQKESIKKALVGLQDDDVCYVSDVDEIWKPKLEFDLEKCDMYRPKLDSYLYYLNLRSSANVEMFTGTIITKYKTIKDSCLNHLRNKTGNKFEWIDNGGWHYEAFGGAEEKINKIKHADYSFMVGKEINLTEKRKDYKNRNLKTWICNGDLPPLDDDILIKYSFVEHGDV